MKLLQCLKHQFQLIHYALLFYTRIPLPSLRHVDAAIENHASRYFTLIGWLIGGVSALAFVVLNEVFSVELSVLLTMLMAIYLTGAFHEDGLADTCDGLGGGWNTTQILDIMKDSRVGTYGLVGLSFVLALKAVALMQLPTHYIPLALLTGHILSRWYSVLVMRLMRYVRLDERSKSKPVTKQFGNRDFVIASAIAGGALVLLQDQLIWASVAMGLPIFYLCLKLKKWLGGYTGDTLGAVQQISELSFYLAFSAILAL